MSTLGHMADAAEEEDAIAASTRDPSGRPSEQEEAKVAPHKTKAVKAALRHAARKDPPRDAFKPFARGSFLIWAVILIGLIWAVGGPGKLIENPPWTTKAWDRSQTTVVKTYEGLTGTSKMQNKTIKELSRSPRKLATVISAAFLAVTGFFAAYYAAIYLAGANVAKGTAVVYHRVLKPAGKAMGKAIARARARSRARALARGAEPNAT